MIKSNTKTEYGQYDVDIDSREYNEQQWYERAVYWKTAFERANTGVQQVMFTSNESAHEHEYFKFDNGIGITKSQYEGIVNFIKSGNHINAIKEVRELTTMGLKESKDWCDNLKANLISAGKMPANAPLSWGSGAHVQKPKPPLGKYNY